MRSSNDQSGMGSPSDFYSGSLGAGRAARAASAGADYRSPPERARRTPHRTPLGEADPSQVGAAPVGRRASAEAARRNYLSGGQDKPLGVSARELASSLGAGRQPVRGMGQGAEPGLLDQITGYLTREGGRQWVEIMDALNNAMWDWQETRDALCGVERYGYYAAMQAGGCPTLIDPALADDAEDRYQRVMRVRDLLAEVYRRYDDFGLDALEPQSRGVAGARGLGEPVTAMTVAAIVAAVAALIGATSLLVWALAEQEDAETRSQAADIARDACDLDLNSAACVEGLRASQAPAKEGIPWGMLALAGVVAVAANAMLKGRQ